LELQALINRRFFMALKTCQFYLAGL